MKEIWGEKSNIVPPYVAASGMLRDVTSESFTDPLNMAEDDEENFIVGNDRSLEVDDAPEIEKNEDVELPPLSRPSSSSSQNSVKKASNRLLKTIKENSPKTAKSAYEEMMKQRYESQEKKLKVEEDKLALERERFEKFVLLERNKFDFEKSKWEEEMELKRKELEVKELQIKADRDIRLKELELESKRLSIPN